MTTAFTLIVILLAAWGIFQLRAWTGRLAFTLHKNPLVDQTLKFQSTQLVLAGGVLGVAWVINPANFAAFFRFGDLQAHISPIAWLGITGGETWLEIALSLGLFITLGTGIFMFFQLRQARAGISWLLPMLGWVVLFSALNAFSEEAIFRMGIVSPLAGQIPAEIVVLISAVMFGVPHYFGMPKGPLGVVMAGFLGGLLALSLLETHGLFLAWAVHFVQDVVIIASMFMIATAQKAKNSIAVQVNEPGEVISR